LYFSRQLSNRAYPVDADSIGLPIVSIGIAVVTLLIPLNLMWWFLLRRYPGKVLLTISSSGLRTGPRLMGWLGLLVSGLCVLTAVLALVDGEFEPAPLFLAWAYIAVAMRAAYIAATSIRQGSPNNPV
jgi:hypothetical protein